MKRAWGRKTAERRHGLTNVGIGLLKHLIQRREIEADLTKTRYLNYILRIVELREN